MRTLFGLFPSSQVTYDVFLASVHPEDQKRVENTINRALLSTTEGDYQIEYRTIGIEDNIERWLSVRGKVFFDGTGRAIRMLGVAWDISHRRRTEDELKRSNEDLERFAHIASHDLQEPLRMVAIYLQLLEKRLGQNLDKETVSYLKFAMEGAIGMRSLIVELLEYSRLGANTLKSELVDCQEMLGVAQSNLRMAIQERGAQITGDPLPKIHGDYVQLSQVFQNIIANAIKFRSEDPPRVHVGYNRKENEWLFWVKR